MLNPYNSDIKVESIFYQHDMAVSDYFQGNDLLWQKFYGDREKPQDWCWDPTKLPPLART